MLARLLLLLEREQGRERDPEERRLRVLLGLVMYCDEGRDELREEGRDEPDVDLVPVGGKDDNIEGDEFEAEGGVMQAADKTAAGRENRRLEVGGFETIAGAGVWGGEGSRMRRTSAWKVSRASNAAAAAAAASFSSFFSERSRRLRPRIEERRCFLISGAAVVGDGVGVMPRLRPRKWTAGRELRRGRAECAGGEEKSLMCDLGEAAVDDEEVDLLMARNESKLRALSTLPVPVPVVLLLTASPRTLPPRPLKRMPPPKPEMMEPSWLLRRDGENLISELTEVRRGWRLGGRIGGGGKSALTGARKGEPVGVMDGADMVGGVDGIGRGAKGWTGVLLLLLLP